MKTPQAHVRDLVLQWLAGLEFPTLFVVAAVLFAVDLVVPDMIPFADEILLGLATLILGRMKQRKAMPPVEVVVGIEVEVGGGDEADAHPHAEVLGVVHGGVDDLEVGERGVRLASNVGLAGAVGRDRGGGAEEVARHEHV